MKSISLFILMVFSIGAVAQSAKTKPGTNLRIEQHKDSSTIVIYRDKEKDPILTQVVKMNERPYIHPIIAPDGKGVLTEYRPDHHPHQTGIFWGLKLVNGRDYFMKWQSDYWQGVSASVIQDKGKEVKWQTVYNIIGEKGEVLMVETQNWSMREVDGKYLLDLEWKGEAKQDVTMGKFYVGGIFVRMPWVKGTIGEIVNSAGQKNMEIEAQRSIWNDVGVKVDGRDDFAHIAILDHYANKAFPTPSRTDTQLGLGISKQILGDWKLAKGETEVMRHRLLIYTGKLDSEALTKSWKDYIIEK